MQEEKGRGGDGDEEQTPYSLLTRSDTLRFCRRLLHERKERRLRKVRPQAKGLATPTDSGHDFNQAIITPRDEIVKIPFAMNNHKRIFSKWILFADAYTFVALGKKDVRRDISP